MRIPHENVLGAAERRVGSDDDHARQRAHAHRVGGQSRCRSTTSWRSPDDIGVAGDPATRQELARQYSYFQTIKYMGYRMQTAASRGVQPGPESSVMKLAAHAAAHHAGDLVMAMSGAAGMLAEDDAFLGGFWQNQFLGQWMSKHRRRYRADPTQHRRRERARFAERTPGRQERGVRRHPWVRSPQRRASVLRRDQPMAPAPTARAASDATTGIGNSGTTGAGTGS